MLKKNKIIILMLLLLTVLAGCRQRERHTLSQEMFIINAKPTLMHDIRELTGKKIKLESIRILDTAWTEVTVFNDTCLASMQNELRKLTSIENAFSDSDLLEDFEKIENLERRIQNYRRENKAIWGYRIEVRYRSGRQKDTLNCEINRQGTQLRAINAGGEYPLDGIEKLNKQSE